MRILRINVILIGFITLIKVYPLYSQSYEKGGFLMGGNITINIADQIMNDQRHTDINIDYDLGYVSTNKSQIGYRFTLGLDNEKNQETQEDYYSHRYAWISYGFYRRRLSDPFYLEIYGGYGKDHSKVESSFGFYGGHNYHITDFGAGIQYHRFVSQRIVIIPGISYDHFILFVKDDDEYFSNQHYNQVIFKIGFHYYFNNNLKLN